MKTIFLLLFPNPLPMLLLLPFSGWISVKYRSKRADALLLMTLSIMPVSLITVNLIRAMDVFAPFKYDQYFYLMDLNFGDPAYRIGIYLAAHPIQQAVIDIIYNLLPYELVVVFGMHLWKTSIEEAWRAAWANFLLFALIVPLYMLFPAVGPGIAFSGYPYTHPDIVTPHLMTVSGLPNCMPSGHFAMSLLTIWLVRKWKWGIVLASIFSLLTLVATLGTGNHYVIDLVMAIPYTALIIYISGFQISWRELCTTHTTEPSIS
jgi:hypothetical protein